MKKIKPEPGVFCDGQQTVFCVFAPYADSVTLKIYLTDTAPQWSIKKELSPVGEGCFGCILHGALGGLYYTYTVDGVETIDPYAKSSGANSKRGYILVNGSADPEGWDKDKFTPVTPVVWEVHVRDFSSDSWLGLTDAGKFTAFRSGVSTKDGKPALIDYLKYLGITYVQLMPVADYGSVDELNGGYNWGYDPVCYFSPEGSYSSNPHDGAARVKELKTLIMNLHSAGIGVILDVVLNHTYTKEGNPLDICAPDYYYRMRGRQPADGSGCGNETKSESAMFRRLMIDCILHYAREYHADGFRFDLMGLHDVDTMNAVRAALDNAFEDGHGKNILMYGEPWYAAPPLGIKGADKEHAFELDERIGMFNDTARNGIRGANYVTAHKGYVQGDADSLEAALSGISGGGTEGGGFMRVISPRQQVLYAACHDDYTLYDHICLTTADGEDRRAMHRMADFMVLSGLGIPLMLAGEEFYRTKGGDGNSYRSGDFINMLDWRQMSREWETVNYYRGLIALRRRNTAFDDLSTARSRFTRLEAPHGTAAYIIGDTLYGVNSTAKDAVIPLPAGEAYLQVCDIERSGTAPFSRQEGAIIIKARNVFAGIREQK